MNDTPRLLHPDRHQHVLEASCLDLQLCPEHRARQVWAFVERADVSGLEASVASRSGGPGAPAISPRLLLALWLYACLDGVGSARELERLCREHAAYRWLCGRVGVNHHTLSDFRGSMGACLDGLLTDMIAALMKAGVVDGSTICQDGTKVPASAGVGSFTGEKNLKRLRVRAARHVAAVKAQTEKTSIRTRARAARERAARERLERVDEALAALREIAQTRAQARTGGRNAHASGPRASKTDPEARIMKLGRGGKRAAYNVQFATDVASRAIVGVQVVQSGSDQGLSTQMRSEVERRTGVGVRTQIADAGYISKTAIESGEQAGVRQIIPLPVNNKGEICVRDQPGDGPGVRRWRARMQTPEAAALLQRRGGIAETPHAELKTLRGMDRLMVRGMDKATGVILLCAIVYNLVHFAQTLIGSPLHPL